MTSDTIQIGDSEVTVRETDDGFEVVSVVEDDGGRDWPWYAWAGKLMFGTFSRFGAVWNSVERGIFKIPLAIIGVIMVIVLGLTWMLWDCLVLFVTWLFASRETFEHVDDVLEG